MRHLLAETIDYVRRHTPFDEEEAQFKNEILALVESDESFANRSRASGHLTVSAWLLSADGASACLLFHHKLQRWLQPGGHLEDFDVSLLAGALRELMEETGLKADEVLPGPFFDVDVHVIPARESVPEHRHYDCRFLFRALPGTEIKISNESNGYRFEPLLDLSQNTSSRSIRRMALKSLQINSKS